MMKLFRVQEQGKALSRGSPQGQGAAVALRQASGKICAFALFAAKAEFFRERHREEAELAAYVMPPPDSLCAVLPEKIRLLQKLMRAFFSLKRAVFQTL